MRLFDDLPRLPEFIARFGDCYGPTTEAHIDGLRMAALTLVGCLIGPRADVRESDGRRVKLGPLCWNTLIAAPSGLGRKSTTANTAIDLAVGVNERWRAQAPDDETDEDEDEDGPADPRSEVFLLPGGIGSSGESMADSIAPPNPASRTLWSEIGPPSCLVTLDEAGPLFAPSRQRGPHHESLRRFLLETYGGHHPGRRTVRGGIVLGGPCAVSSIGTVTTSELLECLSADAVTSGLLGRIIAVSVPAINEEQLHPFWREPDADQVAALERWILAAARVRSWPVRFSPEAEDVWREWYTSMWRHYATRSGNGNGASPTLEIETTVLARYQNLAQRLAVALTITDWSPAPWPYVPGRQWRRNPPHPPEELVISAGAMAVCCLTVTELARNVSRLIEEAFERADGFTRYQEAFLASVRNAGGRLDRRAAGQAVRAKRFALSASQAEQAREDLVRSGMLEVEIEKTGRRPREVFVAAEVS